MLRGQNVPAPRTGTRREWEPRGFDFSPDGVWRKKAQAVARARQAAMARGDFAALNRQLQRPGAAPAGPDRVALAVADTLRVPVLLVRFQDTDPGTVRAPSAYDSVLLGTTPPVGRPYTVRTFYSEMSHGLLTVQGVVIGWITLDSTLAWYAGAAACDGLCFESHMPQLIQQAVAHADSAGLDWGQFDNDGPDGIPNSGDDDSSVDLIWLIQPRWGAECGQDGNIWSHRSYYRFWTGTPLATSTPGRNGGNITVDSYTIQSGVGGESGCDFNQIMPPGIVAHETGHGLGLPDLYDISYTTAGIGYWGLMGLGGWSEPFSPSHMEAFSLAQLGWVTVVPITATGEYQAGPIETGDTAFLVRPTTANPRGEFFMLENRQALLADTAMIAAVGGGGLLLWHVDSAQYARGLHVNHVNTGSVHGVRLVEADGDSGLDCRSMDDCDHGDAGDPYPGSGGVTVFGPSSHPAPTLNGGGFAGFVVDSIRQLTPNGTTAFRVTFGDVSVVGASDTAAHVTVDGVRVNVYRNVWTSGSPHVIAVDSSQLSADGTAQYLFTGWSDGGARSHGVTGSSAGASYTAQMAVRYLARYEVAGAGGVTSNRPSGGSGGTFVTPGDTVRLTAVAAAGLVFLGWSGDTTAGDAVLALRMTRPFRVTAQFAAPGDVVNQLLSGSSPLSSAAIRLLDQLGNNDGRFDLGDLVAWLDRNPGLASSPVVLKLLRSLHR